mmetsp:Transcript_9366/g.20067  ORF Transcript_9366/g.20067 Transcript_9366/m.20067 type:complete len:482 (+) Transcript_9366:56-1501(+)
MTAAAIFHLRSSCRALLVVPTHSAPSTFSTTSSRLGTGAIVSSIRRLGVERGGPPSQLRSESTDDLVSTATSYLTALRLRAVSALTTSLTSKERDEILKSLNAVDGQVAEEESRRSIGEAVASAVQKEAATNESKWAREREIIEARSKQAAEERIKYEIALAERRRGLEQWQKEVAAEKESAEEKPKEAQQQQQQDVEYTFEDSAPGIGPDEENKTIHPILGTALLDLGYKRIHTVSARCLASIPVWEKQRVYRHDRAKAMAADKARSTHTGLPGIITLHEAMDGQLAILDGQHRVGMMAILEGKVKVGGKDKSESTDPGFDIDLDTILVEVFPHKNPEKYPKHAEDIFVEINKAEPVKLVDLPGVANVAERKIINGAAEALKNSFPEMFKPSTRCRQPHLNLDNLRDALFSSDVLKRHSLKSDKALVDWMMEKNALLAKEFAAQGANGGRTASKSVSKSALAKAEKFNFFLGLDSTWLYQ